MSAGFIAISEKFIFAEALGLDEKFEFSWLNFLGSVLYGGIIEEVLLRFGLMSLIIWIASKITKSVNSNGIYIAGIVIAALIFAAGHLPATAQMLGLSPLSVIRTLLLNFFAGARVWLFILETWISICNARTYLHARHQSIDSSPYIVQLTMEELIFHDINIEHIPIVNSWYCDDDSFHVT